MGTAKYGMATEAEHEEVFAFLNSVFGTGDRRPHMHRIASADPYYQPEQRHLVRVDGEVVSHVYTPRRVTRIGIAEVEIGGIMWVGTSEAHRRKGYARELMCHVFDYLKAEGRVASPLTTPLRDFYRPLGYEDYHNEVRTRIDTSALPSGDVDGLTTEPYRPDDLPEVMSIYDAFFAEQSWTLCRSQAYWEWLLGQLESDDLTLVAKDGDRVVGYLIYVSHDPAQLIRDNAVWESAHAAGYGMVHEALLSALRERLEERGTESLNLTLPTRHPMTRLVRELGGTTEVWACYPGSSMSRMMKVVDLSAYLRGIQPELERRIQHSHLAEYRGSLGVAHRGQKFSQPEGVTLHLDRGRIDVEETSSGNDVICGDERWMCQVLIGERGLGEASDLGLVEVSTDQARALGEVLLPNTYPWRADLDNDTG